MNGPDCGRGAAPRALCSFVGVALLVGCGDADGASEADAVLAEYEQAYNARDVDAALALFTDDAVINGHPMRRSIEGSQAIRSLHNQDINASATSDAYDMIIVESDGNSVIFDHTWRNAAGECYAGAGHTIVVEDGLISRWDWGTKNLPCEGA